MLIGASRGSDSNLISNTLTCFTVLHFIFRRRSTRVRLSVDLRAGLLHRWILPSAHHFHSWRSFKDIALSQQHVVETIQIKYLTKPSSSLCKFKVMPPYIRCCPGSHGKQVQKIILQLLSTHLLLSSVSCQQCCRSVGIFVKIPVVP